MKNIRLKSFEYISTQSGGWSSDKVTFSDRTTVLQGPNGSGKSPMLKGMMFALGDYSEIPSEIREKCTFACLTININNNTCKISRMLTLPKSCEGEIDYNNKKYYFDTEALLSKYLFEFIEIRDEEVFSKFKNDGLRSKTRLYMNQLIPFFYSSQSKGWMDIHSYPSGNEIVWDQTEEIFRVFFDLPCAHKYMNQDKLKKMIKSKKKLVQSSELAEDRIGALKHSLGKNIALGEVEIKRLKKQYKDEVTLLRNSLSISDDSSSEAQISLINDLSRKRMKIQSELNKKKVKEAGLKHLLAETNTQLEIENDAQNVTLEFQRFCGLRECGLFKQNKIPFGKKVMYLADQLKDVENAQKTLISDCEDLEYSYTQITKEIEKENKKLNSGIKSDKDVNALDRIEASTKEFTYFSEQDALFDEYSKKISDRDGYRSQIVEYEDSIELFKGNKKKTTDRQREIVLKLEHFYKYWVDDILKTPNTYKSDVGFDTNFDLLIKGRKFTTESEKEGSTRLRIILAYKAALLETALYFGANYPKILILDTPRQDEINQGDLNDYFQELDRLRIEFKVNIQVVLAYKDKIFDLDDSRDDIFEPSFPGKEKDMFLGSVEDLL